MPYLKKTFKVCSVFFLAVMVSGCQGDLGDGLDDLEGGVTSSPTTTTTTLPAGPSPDWELALNSAVPDSASDGGVARTSLVAGHEAEATDGFDPAFDSVTFLFGPVQAYFDHTGEVLYAGQEKLWKDIRADDFPKEWRFVVLAAVGKDLTLNWTLPVDPKPNCLTHSFIVTDRDGILPDVDLCSAVPIEYTGDGLERNFTLTVAVK